MAVTCAKCNEPLLGAVNRCWKCGAEFNTQLSSQQVPPIRRTPVELTARLTDSMATASSETPGVVADVTAATEDAVDHPKNVPFASTETHPAVPGTWQGRYRVGSPFATTTVQSKAAKESTLPRETRHILDGSAGRAQYPSNIAASGAAIAAMILGILSQAGILLLLWGVLLHPIGTLLTALLGIILGIWGIYSPKSRIAIWGLLFCCLALAVGGFFAVVDVYQQTHNTDPTVNEIEDLQILNEDSPSDFDPSSTSFRRSDL